jgi:hypothetical protein
VNAPVNAQVNAPVNAQVKGLVNGLVNGLVSALVMATRRARCACSPVGAASAISMSSSTRWLAPG